MVQLMPPTKLIPCTFHDIEGIIKHYIIFGATNPIRIHLPDLKEGIKLVMWLRGVGFLWASCGKIDSYTDVEYEQLTLTYIMANTTLVIYPLRGVLKVGGQSVDFIFTIPKIYPKHYRRL